MQHEHMKKLIVNKTNGRLNMTRGEMAKGICSKETENRNTKTRSTKTRLTWCLASFYCLYSNLETKAIIMKSVLRQVNQFFSWSKLSVLYHIVLSHMFKACNIECLINLCHSKILVTVRKTQNLQFLLSWAFHYLVNKEIQIWTKVSTKKKDLD